MGNPSGDKDGQLLIERIRHACVKGGVSSAVMGAICHEVRHAPVWDQMKALSEDSERIRAKLVMAADDEIMRQEAARSSCPPISRDEARYHFLRTNYPRMIISICCGTYQGQTIEEAEVRLDAAIERLGEMDGG